MTLVRRRSGSHQPAGPVPGSRQWCIPTRCVVWEAESGTEAPQHLRRYTRGTDSGPEDSHRFSFTECTYGYFYRNINCLL